MTQILIVEDSMYQRRRIRRALEGEGYKLLEAANGREGLEMAASNKLDCILLDLIMPEVDGLEVLQSLRAQGSNVRTVVFTADIQESTRQRCLELGATAFVNKPLREDELVNVVRQVLGDKAREEGAVQ